MKKLTTLCLMVLMTVAAAFGQDRAVPEKTRNFTQKLKKLSEEQKKIFDELADTIANTDARENMLVSPAGLNMLQQQVVMNYLTGNSDLSLAAFYAAYTTDDDRLKLGFNIPLNNRYSKRLNWVATPLFEADVKDGLTTLYEKGKWQSDMRVGAKLTWLPAGSLLWFDTKAKGQNKEAKRLEVLRTKTYEGLLDSIIKLNEFKKSTFYTVDCTEIDLQKIYENATDEDIEELKDEVFRKVAEKEAALVKKDESYNIFTTYWISFWGLVPVTQEKRQISTVPPQPFSPIKFNNWELNLQMSYVVDWNRFGTAFFSVWGKLYNNNTAATKQMTEVTYSDYLDFVPNATSDYLSSATYDSGKAFIGNFERFVTPNLNLQAVYMFPLRKHLIRPGISIRCEQNWGSYSARNWRFGLPLTIQGKEKPVNIELQYRRDNVNNYAGKTDYKVEPMLGFSLALPITSLY